MGYYFDLGEMICGAIKQPLTIISPKSSHQIMKSYKYCKQTSIDQI